MTAFLRDRCLVARELRDWGFLDGCFGDTRIRPSDLDGILEVNGHFLVLESKRANSPAARGQARLLDALARLERFTVLIVIGDPIVAMQRPGEPSSRYADDAVVRAFVCHWYHRAIGHRP